MYFVGWVRHAITLQLFCFSLRIMLTMRSYHQNYQRHQNPWLGISHQKRASLQNVHETWSLWNQAMVTTLIHEKLVKLREAHLIHVYQSIVLKLTKIICMRYWQMSRSLYPIQVFSNFGVTQQTQGTHSLLWRILAFGIMFCSHTKPGTVKCVSKLLILP